MAMVTWLTILASLVSTRVVWPGSLYLYTVQLFARASFFIIIAQCMCPVRPASHFSVSSVQRLVARFQPQSKKAPWAIAAQYMTRCGAASAVTAAAAAAMRNAYNNKYSSGRPRTERRK